MTSSETAPAGMVKPPAYLSIDFEDLGADMLRFLGADRSATARPDALWKSYEDIRRFSVNALGGKPLTFFCTGILGEQVPDLIAQIAKDGNEIGCHYHYHDMVGRDVPEVVDERLKQAIDALQTASNTEVIGFRAPRFSITRDQGDQFRMISRHFRYDSSLIADVEQPFDEGSYADITLDGKLRLFPVPLKRQLNKIGHKAGGTYFKLFPLDWTVQTLRGAADAGRPAVFYIHPHEFAVDGRFMLSREQLKPLGAARQHYWWLRQSQWHIVGNGGALKKLAALAKHVDHQGNMRDLLTA